MYRSMVPSISIVDGRFPVDLCLLTVSFQESRMDMILNAIYVLFVLFGYPLGVGPLSHDPCTPMPHVLNRSIIRRFLTRSIALTLTRCHRLPAFIATIPSLPPNTPSKRYKLQEGRMTTTAPHYHSVGTATTDSSPCCISCSRSPAAMTIKTRIWL